MRTITLAITTLVVLAASSPARGGDAKPVYPKMAPIAQYLIADRNKEIALARTAAPAAISSKATILVLGKHGFETAANGTNGFVCMVDRGFTGALDFPEVWNPKLRGPDCLNPLAAHSLLPVVYKVTGLVLAGDSEDQIIAALKAAYKNGQLPPLEPGSMSFMMSKYAYLTDQDGHNLPHLMIYNPLPNGTAWGAGLTHVPIATASYWFPNDDDTAQAHGLPSIRVFIVAVKHWSDGTTPSPQ